jgi:hypothetical protein
MQSLLSDGTNVDSDCSVQDDAIVSVAWIFLAHYSVTNSYWGKTVEFDDGSDAEYGMVLDNACSSVFGAALPLVVQWLPQNKNSETSP